LEDFSNEFTQPLQKPVSSAIWMRKNGGKNEEIIPNILGKSTKGMPLKIFLLDFLKAT
jgi:hypothetical protein